MKTKRELMSFAVFLHKLSVRAEALKGPATIMGVNPQRCSWQCRSAAELLAWVCGYKNPGLEDLYQLHLGKIDMKALVHAMAVARKAAKPHKKRVADHFAM